MLTEPSLARAAGPETIESLLFKMAPPHFETWPNRDVVRGGGGFMAGPKTTLAYSHVAFSATSQASRLLHPGGNTVEIEGKKAVVVGGPSGMAQAAAELLVHRGASVAILELPTSAGAEVAAHLGRAFHSLGS